MATEIDDEVLTLDETGKLAVETPTVEIVEDKPKAPSLEDSIALLKANLEDEKKARAKAETEANEARARETAAKNEALSARTQADDSNLRMVEGAITQVKTTAEQLEAAWVRAGQEGDLLKQAKIQTQMAVNANRLVQLENGKREMEEAAKAPRPMQRQDDPTDAYIANVEQSSPNSAAWLRSHKQYITNPNLRSKMMSAHYAAEADGITTDTPEYLDFVEKRLGLKQAPAQETEMQLENPLSAAAAPIQRQSPPAAPPSRQASPGNRGKTVTLTRAQLEAAEISGLTPAEYAANLPKAQ